MPQSIVCWIRFGERFIFHPRPEESSLNLVNVNRLRMITQYIVSDIANPEFGSDGAKAFGEGAGEDVVGAVFIVEFSG